MNSYKQLLITLLITLGLAPDLVMAAELKVHTELSTQSFYMGEAFTITILVDGTDKVKIPNTDGLSDLSVRLVDDMALSTQERTGYSIRYQIVPLKSGLLTIPALDINADGEILQTKPIEMEVKIPQRHPGLKLEVSLSTDECYVGEPILATFTWSTSLPLYAFRSVDVRMPLLNSPNFRTLDSPADQNPSKETIGLPVSNNRIIAERGRAKIEESTFETLRFQKIIIPRSSGKLTIPPTSLLCSFIPPNKQRKHWRPQYPSFFNNSFFDGAGNSAFEKYFVESAPIDLKVKPLPIEGRPADFAGVVGRCTITATAEPKILHAGDPLTLTIEIKDHPQPATLALPSLAEQPAFNRSFSIPTRQSSGRILQASRVFIRSLRPLRPDVTQVPAVRIPYFDPAKGVFGVAQSQAIPITVKPARKITAFDADISSGKPVKNKLETNPEGIRQNIESASAITDQPTCGALILGTITLLPPIAFLAFVLLTANHRLSIRDPRAARAKVAYRNFRKATASIQRSGVEEPLLALDDTVRAYFADKLGLTQHAHTFDELAPKLQEKNCAADDLASLQKVYEACDLKRFTEKPVTIQANELIPLAEQTIQRINGRI